MRSQSSGTSAALAQRAQAWRSAAHAAVCDVVLPWAHGTVVRATRHPSYYDYNLVRVEDEPPLSAGELAAYAEEALAEVSHRRLDFDVLAAGEAVRGELVELGWRPTRLLWMHHAPAAPAAPAAPGSRTREAPAVRVEEVPYEAVLELRLSWHAEDFGAIGAGELEHYRTAGKEVELSRGARVFALRERGRPIAFAQLERLLSQAEVSQVYVHPDRRGQGLGTALTRAAIAAAGDVRHLWIVADDEDHAKELYARLGFRPAWTSMEFLLVP